jgi:hypothetical protein
LTLPGHNLDCARWQIGILRDMGSHFEPTQAMIPQNR